MLTYNEGSFTKALLAVYPAIGLKLDSFGRAPRKSSLPPSLSPPSFSPSLLPSFFPFPPIPFVFPPLRGVLQSTNSLFPSPFIISPANYWTSPDNCRKLFVDYAETMEFDYKNPDNWYPVTLAQLTKFNKVLPTYNFLPFND